MKCTDGEGGDAVPRSSGNGKQVANDGSGERRWKPGSGESKNTAGDE